MFYLKGDFFTHNPLSASFLSLHKAGTRTINQIDYYNIAYLHQTEGQCLPSISFQIVLHFLSSQTSLMLSYSGERHIYGIIKTNLQFLSAFKIKFARFQLPALYKLHVETAIFLRSERQRCAKLMISHHIIAPNCISYREYGFGKRV